MTVRSQSGRLLSAVLHNAACARYQGGECDCDRQEVLDGRQRVRDLAAELSEWKRMRNEAMAVAIANRERITALEAALRGVRAKLAEYLERLLQGRALPNRWVGEINDIVQAVAVDPTQSSPAATSELCAVCDQIKELHPNTHSWTPGVSAASRATALETKVAPIPSHEEFRQAHLNFRDVMIDTLERATQFLSDRANDGVTDEDDDALLRECECVIQWAKQTRPATSEPHPEYSKP